MPKSDESAGTNDTFKPRLSLCYGTTKIYEQVEASIELVFQLNHHKERIMRLGFCLRELGVGLKKVKQGSRCLKFQENIKRVMV
jgi:hypothetical protein